MSRVICRLSRGSEFRIPGSPTLPKELESKDIKLGEDEPGCKDSALLARIPGCSIIQCDTKEADTLEIQVGMSTDGAVQKESMDGAGIASYLGGARQDRRQE